METSAISQDKGSSNGFSFSINAFFTLHGVHSLLGQRAAHTSPLWLGSLGVYWVLRLSYLILSKARRTLHKGTHAPAIVQIDCSTFPVKPFCTSFITAGPVVIVAALVLVVTLASR